MRIYLAGASGFVGSNIAYVLAERQGEEVIAPGHEHVELVWRALEHRRTGILHCCGGEHIDRVGLARRAVEVFELDPELLEVGPPPASALAPAGSVPRDTRLDAGATAAALGTELAGLDLMLSRLREEFDSVWSPT